MKRLSMKMILKKQPDSVHKEPDFQVKKKRKKGSDYINFCLKYRYHLNHFIVNFITLTTNS